MVKPPGVYSGSYLGTVRRDLYALLYPPEVLAGLGEAEQTGRLPGTSSTGIQTPPAGMDVAKFRRALKLGHGGTLDPMATGLLIVGLQEGCKLLHTVKECNKVTEHREHGPPLNVPPYS
jgi:tRNA U55 pseudouridine synthase TruB